MHIKNILILVGLLLFTASGASYSALVSTVKKDSTLNIVKLLPNYVKTPADLSLWLKAHTTYQAEKTDYWKTPLETFIDAGGDCEDFAIFVRSVLLEWDIEGQIIFMKGVVEGEKRGHMIFVYKVGQYYNIFDNQYLFSTTYRTVKQLMRNSYPEYSEFTFATPKKAISYIWQKP